MQKSLLKAMQLIEHMTTIGEEIGVSDLAKAFNLNKSNVHDILVTFESMGFIKKNESNRRYSLGNKFLEVANSISQQQYFRDVARREVNMISQKTGDICYFGIPYGDKVMYLEGGTPDLYMTTKPVLGMTAPLYCTGIGKAILSHYPKEEIERIANSNLQKVTENTITQPQLLIDQLDFINQIGYSIDDQEHEGGIKCVAVPILDRRGVLRGAMSITGPSPRFPERRIPDLVKLLKFSANVIANSFYADD